VIAPDSLLQSLQQALAGRYVLERPLGRGGMSIVYLAREVRLDRLVAIKLLPPAQAVVPAARARFLREARTAARLSHPNIVPIFAVHEIGEFVCFAMAYVAGETLGQRVRGSGPLGVPEAGRVLRDVALALDHAHAHEIVHRDVKPDNILLDRVAGRALVSDFGIAQATSDGTTTGSRQLGTADFMSPEQARGRPVDARSDIYSLGVVGFYALSGSLPFAGRDAMTVLARHVTDPPPPLASVAPATPRRLAGVIDRCLAKEPDARFPNAATLATAIARAVGEGGAPAVAVRAFVMQSQRLVPAALLYGALAGVALPLLGLHALGFPPDWPSAPDVAAGALIVTLPLGVMVARVRRLLAAGCDRGDLVAALDEECERRSEELAFLYGDGASRLEHVLRWVCYVALGAAVGLVAAAAGLTLLGFAPLVPTLFRVAATVSVLAGVAARARTEHRTDPRTERRLRFWSGFGGRALFAVAGLGLERSDAPTGVRLRRRSNGGSPTLTPHPRPTPTPTPTS
jgi:serine/threonine-protein kinase